MMPYCLIFPGQGSQFVGMSHGANLEGVVDQELIDLMEKGPEDDLGLTIHAQQAIFSVTSSLWEKSDLFQPEMVMGHSLGEYMALVAAGVVSSSDGMALVKNRAMFMERAMPEGKGGMAAVLGLSCQDVSSVIEEIKDVWVANINQARQIVVAGSIQAIREAEPLLKAKGAKKIIPLKVSVASHCPFMESAKKALREYLSGVRMAKPATRVVFNATAQEESDPDKIKTLLADQLVSPVRWEDSVRYAGNAGIRRFVEIGPKSVLASMIKRIIPQATVEVVSVYEH